MRSSAQCELRVRSALWKRIASGGVAFGPGLDWQINKNGNVNFNVYLPILAKNTPAGAQFNIPYIHQL
jgi:hypothetical protein